MKPLPIWFTALSMRAAWLAFKRDQFPKGLPKRHAGGLKNTFFLGVLHGIIRAREAGDIPPENMPRIEKLEREIERHYLSQPGPEWTRLVRRAKD
jgi:hypothetical protein